MFRHFIRLVELFCTNLNWNTSDEIDFESRPGHLCMVLTAFFTRDRILSVAQVTSFSCCVSWSPYKFSIHAPFNITSPFLGQSETKSVLHTQELNVLDFQFLSLSAICARTLLGWPHLDGFCILSKHKINGRINLQVHTHFKSSGYYRPI